MKLEFHGHDERYIVEQSLMNLFPLEKPVYGTVKPGEDDWCRLTAAETAEYQSGIFTVPITVAPA